MVDSLERGFGLTIAFAVPGFVCLCGLSEFSPTLATWLSTEPPQTPQLGGFLYVVLGSLAAGLTASAVRWATIDTLHHATGVPSPSLDWRQLHERLAAFQLAVEHNYRYYQFYANGLIANLVFAICHAANHSWSSQNVLILLALEVTLFLASRDSLKRFYDRAGLVLGVRPEAG